MPKYTLIYFNARARGEIARLIFAQANVEYEDRRLTRDEFQAIKNDTEQIPLGQLPVLLIEGHPPIPQSHTIERHLARTFGLYGKKEAETVLIDVVGESVVDLWNSVYKFFFEKDEAKKAELVNDYLEKTSVPIFTALSKRLEKNSEGNGFLVGDSITLADLAVFDLTDGLFKKFPVLETKYPRLKEFDARIRAIPNIAKWLEKRPVTEF